jgi:hypothetical protein
MIAPTRGAVITTTVHRVPLSGNLIGDLLDTQLLGRGQVGRTCDVHRGLHDALSIVQHFAPMNGSVIVWDLETVPGRRSRACCRGSLARYGNGIDASYQRP